MTYSQGSTHGTMAEINIIPLADVMLVLLIVFMIASPALTRRIVVDMPGKDDGTERPEPPPPIRLRIDAAGDAYWNDSPTPLSALQAMMAGEVQRDRRNPPRLEIDASGDADYQAVTRVLAAAHNAELSRIAFIRRD
jgi:biopolymer transport protein ExbD